MIRRLLIANRGEIACRIARTARRLEVTTAAVYSDPDRGALHTQLADFALAIGGASAAESYLNIGAIIEAAQHWKADAIHPGYGFLSENPLFARAVVDAGMIFVGPSSEAIEAMGSKARAKALMSAAGVPLLPGYHGEEQSLQALQAEAIKLGFPLLIKAAAGGGGRGLRIVESSDQFASALEAVQREARATFGDERVLLERYLTGARHIEVQVFGDIQGNCLHLFERDCSIQRRHQKLIEEAPAPGLPEGVRSRMTRAAISAARAINYTGAGTVEFLYQDGAFYFMEMNTRLQVEHPVTEAITGIDLVEWQLRVAQGDPLPLQQHEVSCSGCAIEARLNAEDPANDFMPGTGLLDALQWPERSPGTRIDTGFRTGDRIGIHYDSLLAKVIVHAPTRQQAADRLAAMLHHTVVRGPRTNRLLLSAVLSSSAFQQARISTGFLQAEAADLQQGVERLALQAAAPAISDWGSLQGWRNLAHSRSSRDYHLLELPAPVQAVDTAAGGISRQGALHAPLPGRLIAVHIREGDRVKQGEPLLVMEAMKMEHTIRASADCVVAAIHCQVNQTLQPDQLLIEFED